MLAGTPGHARRLRVKTTGCVDSTIIGSAIAFWWRRSACPCGRDQRLWVLSENRPTLPKRANIATELKDGAQRVVVAQVAAVLHVSDVREATARELATGHDLVFFSTARGVLVARTTARVFAITVTMEIRVVVHVFAIVCDNNRLVRVSLFPC
jgi:hypothetical protein